MDYKIIRESFSEIVLGRTRVIKVVSFILIIIGAPFLLLGLAALIPPYENLSLLFFPGMGIAFVAGAVLLKKTEYVFPDNIIFSAEKRAVLLSRGKEIYEIPFSKISSVEKKQTRGAGIIVYLRLVNHAIIDIAVNQSIRQKKTLEVYEKLSTFLKTYSQYQTDTSLNSDGVGPNLQENIFFFKDRHFASRFLWSAFLILGVALSFYAGASFSTTAGSGIISRVFSFLMIVLAFVILISGLMKIKKGHVFKFGADRLEYGYARSKEAVLKENWKPAGFKNYNQIHSIIYSMASFNGEHEFILIAEADDLDYLENLRINPLNFGEIKKLLVQRFKGIRILFIGYNALELFFIADKLDARLKGTV